MIKPCQCDKDSKPYVIIESSPSYDYYKIVCNSCDKYEDTEYELYKTVNEAITAWNSTDNSSNHE